MKRMIKRLKSKKAASQSVSTMISVIVFTIFLALFISIFAFFAQYMSLAGFTDSVMEVASYYASYDEIEAKVQELAAAKGYEVEVVAKDTDFDEVPEPEDNKVVVYIISPDFDDYGNAGLAVQYGDEIGVSVSKRAVINFLGSDSFSMFNMNCKKIGISQNYFKPESEW